MLHTGKSSRRTYKNVYRSGRSPLKGFPQSSHNYSSFATILIVNNYRLFELILGYPSVTIPLLSLGNYPSQTIDDAIALISMIETSESTMCIFTGYLWIPKTISKQTQWRQSTFKVWISNLKIPFWKSKVYKSLQDQSQHSSVIFRLSFICRFLLQRFLVGNFSISCPICWP